MNSFGFENSGLGIIQTDGKYAGQPVMSLEQLGLSFGATAPLLGVYTNVYHVSDGWSRLVSRHTLKFGGEYRYLQLNNRQTSTNGNFGFAGGETGNDFADYLIGAPDSYGQASAGGGDDRTHYGGIYGEDSFKFRPNFTVNYGLRWEVSQPWYDRWDRIQAFVPGLQSTKFPDSPTGWVFPGDPGIPRTLSPTRWGDVAPRLGLAYSPGFSQGVLGKLFGGPGKPAFAPPPASITRRLRKYPPGTRSPTSRSASSMAALPWFIWKSLSRRAPLPTIPANGSPSWLRLPAGQTPAFARGCPLVVRPPRRSPTCFPTSSTSTFPCNARSPIQ